MFLQKFNDYRGNSFRKVLPGVLLRSSSTFFLSFTHPHFIPLLRGAVVLILPAYAVFHDAGFLVNILVNRSALFVGHKQAFPETLRASSSISALFSRTFTNETNGTPSSWFFFISFQSTVVQAGFLAVSALFPLAVPSHCPRPVPSDAEMIADIQISLHLFIRTVNQSSYIL